MDPTQLLKKARLSVSPETFSVISLKQSDWFKLLENPELSPRMSAPFMIFMDRWEVTLILDEIDLGKIRPALGQTPIEGGFRLLSFDVELGFEVIGFLARIAEIFSVAGISILSLSSFSRDHILVKQTDLAAALQALRGHVDEIC